METLEGVADRLEIRDGDAWALPFADASFDVVLANFALPNLPSHEGKLQTCREIAPVLKPGGRSYDYDMIFTTGRLVRGSAAAGLAVQTSGLIWRTYPPGRLIVGRKPQVPVPDARRGRRGDDGRHRKRNRARTIPERASGCAWSTGHLIGDRAD